MNRLSLGWANPFRLLSFLLFFSTIINGVPHDNMQMRDYSNYKVIRFQSKNHSQVIDDIVKPLTSDYEIWNFNKNFIDIQLTKDEPVINTILNESKRLKVDYNVMIEDVDNLVEATFPQNGDNDALLFPQLFEQQKTIKKGDVENNKQIAFNSNNEGNRNDNDNFHTFETVSKFFFKNYRNLNTLNLWFDLLEKIFPSFVQLETIGVTPQGNELRSLHISAHNKHLNPKRKTIIIMGGIHSREWVGISTVNYILFNLLVNSTNNTASKEFEYLNKLDFIFVPIFNPDGYDYTWTTDRLWRKNRQETKIPQCPGIDLDRSFDFEWDSNDESPCSENYSGLHEFDAVEAKLWDDYLKKYKKHSKIYGFIDFHSYSQEILYPYAFSCEKLPRDFENLLELSYGLSKAIRVSSGKQYDVIQACKDRDADLIAGSGSGSSLDYMYNNKAYWAFQIKLRDTGNHGFLLPPKFIEPVGEEAYAAVKYFCDFILNPEL